MEYSAWEAYHLEFGYYFYIFLGKRNIGMMTFFHHSFHNYCGQKWEELESNKPSKIGYV